MASTNGTATMGKVGTPEKGANGSVKVYVHDTMSGGGVGLIYRPANMVELGDALYSMVGDGDTRTLETVRTLLVELDEKAAFRAAKTATPVDAPIPAPVVKPAPVAAPVVAFGKADVMALKGMSVKRAGVWTGHRWTEVDMAHNLKTGGYTGPMPTLPVFVAALLAASKGDEKAAPVSKPAPVATVAQTVAAPVVKAAPAVVAKVLADAVAAPTPVATGKVYASADELKGDDVKALASKLGITLVEGRGAFMKNRATVWAAYKAAPVATVTVANKPATPAPVSVPQNTPAPVSKTFKAGTLLVADGKGGVRIATDADILAAMEALTGN